MKFSKPFLVVVVIFGVVAGMVCVVVEGVSRFGKRQQTLSTPQILKDLE
jgi:hypothetical protein